MRLTKDILWLAELFELWGLWVDLEEDFAAAAAQLPRRKAAVKKEKAPTLPGLDFSAES